MTARARTRSATHRATTIVRATRQLAAVIRSAYEEDKNHESLRIAYECLANLLTMTDTRGEEIPGWAGSCLTQTDAIQAVMSLLECYDAHKN